MIDPFQEYFDPTANLSKVYFPETKELIKESIYCFSNGIYRSSITTLYTTLIFDLIKKLEYLSEIENDSKAKRTLEEVRNIREEKPASPEWESTLLNKCQKELKLFSAIDLSNLKIIKEIRNQAAHPVISIEGDDYFVQINEISKEQVISSLSDAFRIVFTRKPIIESNLNDKFLEYSAKYWEQDPENFEKYIKINFLDKMSDNSKNRLFKSLWKLKFSLSNSECDKSRIVNVKFLNIFHKENPELFDSSIKNNPDSYFTNLDLDYYGKKLDLNEKKYK